VDHEHLGIASPEQLSWAYSEARVGLCLSMTNYSLIPQEMLACGLPCVDLAGFSAETVFGADGPVELAQFDPIALADAIERLLDDDGLWARRSEAGRDFVAGRTWDRAAEQVEAGLREALQLQEEAYAQPVVDRDGVALEPAGLVPGIAPPAGTEWSARSVPVAVPGSRPVTRALLARLSPADLDTVTAHLDAGQAALLEQADDGTREHLRLALGVWHRVPAVLAKTGLSPDEPGPEIHAMARGPLAAGGDLYSADMVVEAVEAAGGDMRDVGAALDFGCSSGRALRPLAATWPDVRWHGVDPNAPAIAWAGEHIPGVSFGVSPTDPPLDLAPGSLDLVYAISIWSHFGEDAARRWLAEMHRVLSPGGLLVATVHGMQSVAYYAATGQRPARQLEQIRRALYRRGFWFAPEFGSAGDHGVRHDEWGNAFMTPEWLLRAIDGAWDLAHYGVGRNAGNQDVAVLRRRSG
jgi:SAM-dependent methyltransferase